MQRMRPMRAMLRVVKLEPFFGGGARDVADLCCLPTKEARVSELLSELRGGARLQMNVWTHAANCS